MKQPPIINQPPVISTNPSLKPCRDCGYPVSKHAEICPHCGKAMRAKHKSRVSLVLAGLLVLISVVAIVYTSRNMDVYAPKGKFATAGTHQFETVSNSAWDSSVWQVEKWLKKNLKDPGSFEAIEWSPVAKTADGFVVRCKYRAKNSFGGYVIEDRIFKLDKSGNVIWSGSKGRN